MNRCAYCGLFRAWKWLVVNFTPDTAFTAEEIFYHCKRGHGCAKKGKK